MIGTSALVDRLRDEGFEVYPGYVHSLVRERAIAPPPKGPGCAFIWQPADVDRLRYELARRGRGPAEGLGNGKGAVHVY